MSIKNRNVKIRWHNVTKNRYIEKGYIFTKYGDEFYVDIDDLPKSSTFPITVVCDYCGKDVEKKYSDYVKTHSEEFGDACYNCRHIKEAASVKSKYGEKSYVETEEFKNKREAKMLEKYGTTHALQNNDCKEKFKATCIERYNVDYPMQCEDIKNKRVETCIEKYGVENTLSAPEIRQSIIETCMDKYGVYTTALVPSVREKQRESLYENGTIKSSKPERETVKILKDIYGEDNCIPQYPTKYYNLDCLLIVDKIKIDVEYDGGWCHDINFDNRRDKYHINHGYKILRIKLDGHKVPTREQLIKAIDYLVNTQENYIEITQDT